MSTEQKPKSARKKSARSKLDFTVDYAFLRKHLNEIKDDLIVGYKLNRLLLPIGLIGLVVVILLFMFNTVAGIIGVVVWLGAMFLSFGYEPEEIDETYLVKAREGARLGFASLVVAHVKAYSPETPEEKAAQSYIHGRGDVYAAVIATEDKTLMKDREELERLAALTHQVSQEPPPNPMLEPLAVAIRQGLTSATQGQSLYPPVVLPSEVAGNDRTYEGAVMLVRDHLPEGYLSKHAKKWAGRFPVLLIPGRKQLRIALVPYRYWNETAYKSQPREPRHDAARWQEATTSRIPTNADNWPYARA